MLNLLHGNNVSSRPKLVGGSAEGYCGHIDEQMKDALQSDCTRYAPGIEIICVRVTKSTILEIIR
ncbi:Erlin-2 [Bienertia sinuspersici]